MAKLLIQCCRSHPVSCCCDDHCCCGALKHCSCGVKTLFQSTCYNPVGHPSRPRALRARFRRPCHAHVNGVSSGHLFCNVHTPNKLRKSSRRRPTRRSPLVAQPTERSQPKSMRSFVVTPVGPAGVHTVLRLARQETDSTRPESKDA